MTKRRVEKNPERLMDIADQAKRMMESLSPSDYQTWKSKQTFFWHEARPGCVVVDKDRRLISFFSLPSARKYVHRLPRTGWSTLREIQKLLTRDAADSDLEDLILSGRISQTTTRDDVDDMRSAKKRSCSLKPVRPRH